MLLFFGYRLNWVNGVTLDRLLTLVWIVGMTNAFNLLDNMDGLCAGIAIIAGAALLVELLPVHRRLAGVLRGAATSRCCSARPPASSSTTCIPASIFMGDSGSLLLGFSLAAVDAERRASTITGGPNVLSIVAVPVLVLLIPIFDTTLVTLSRMAVGPAGVAGRPRSLVAPAGRDRPVRALARSTLLWLLAAAGGAIGVAFRTSAAWWSIVAAMFAVGMTLFAVYLGGIRVYDDDRRGALERGSSTPIVVDFIYKRRVAEVLLDFVLVTVLYYAAYRLRFEFIEFAANFTYFTQSLPVVVAAQLAAFFAVGVYRGVWRHFSASDAVTVVRGALTSTILSALIFAYMFRDVPTTPNVENYSSTVLIIYAVVVVLMVTGSRASFRVISDVLQRRRQTGRRIVVYGAGDGGAMAVRELLSNPDHDVRLVGFIDDDPRKRRARVRGYPVLGSFDTLSQLVLSSSLDAIVLSTRSIDAIRLRQLETLCADHAVELSRLVVGLEPVVDTERAATAGNIRRRRELQDPQVPTDRTLILAILKQSFQPA